MEYIVDVQEFQGPCENDFIVKKIAVLGLQDNFAVSHVFATPVN